MTKALEPLSNSAQRLRKSCFLNSNKIATFCCYTGFMNETKLIILRGPSGSGKSSVAKWLFEQATGRVALIEQDHYRFMFKPAGGGGKYNSDTVHRLIRHNVLEVLQDGYDVILEGILSVKSYGEVFETIFAEHPQENYIFYFDISLEETLRRHKAR